MSIAYFADKLSRKYTIVLGKSVPKMFVNSSLILHTAVCVFCVGVIVQTAAKNPDYIYGGKS
jgi:hypothetical protein